MRKPLKTHKVMPKVVPSTLQSDHNAATLVPVQSEPGFRTGIEVTFMSDVGAQTRKVEYKSSIKLLDMAKPKKVLASLGDAVSAVIGHIHGFTNSIVTRTLPDGSGTYEGMAGQFEIVPSGSDASAIRSGLCYMPKEMQAPITAILREQAGPDGKGQVTGASFAFEVSIHKAANGDGFEYKLEPIVKPVGLDPLVETRKALSARVIEHGKTPAKRPALEKAK